jgi:hypothetical protein
MPRLVWGMPETPGIWLIQIGQLVRQIAEHQHYVQGVAWDPLVSIPYCNCNLSDSGALEADQSCPGPIPMLICRRTNTLPPNPPIDQCISIR